MCILNYFKQLVYMRFVFSDIVYAGLLCSTNLHNFFFFVFRSLLLASLLLLCVLPLPLAIFLHLASSKVKTEPPQTKNRKTASLHKKLTKNEKIKIKYTQKYTHTPSPTCAQQRYDRSTFLFEFEINSCACHVIDRNMFFLLVFSLFARWKPKISQCARGIFDCPTLRCFVFIQCE